MLSLKYQPAEPDQYYGHQQLMKHLIQWLKDWRYQNKQEPKIIILYGKPGTGKTSLAMLIPEGIMPIYYSNASDERKKDDIKRLISGLISHSFKKNVLYIIDEADDVTLPKEILLTQNPIMVIANDYYKLPKWIRLKRKEIYKHEFGYPNIMDKTGFITEIFKRENVQPDIAIVTELVHNSLSYRDILNNMDLFLSGYNQKDRILGDNDIYSLLNQISNGNIELNHRDNIDPHLLSLWLFDNSIYSPDNLSKIAKADRWLKLSKTEQNFRQWKYIFPLLYSCKGIRTGFPYSFGMSKKKEEKEEIKIVITKEPTKPKPSSHSIFEYGG